MEPEFWEHLIRHESDPAAALLRLQAEVFALGNYDLPLILAERIDDMTGAIEWCYEYGDELGLLDHYRDARERLENLADQDLPISINARVALFRKIEAIGSDRAPGVLACEGISTEPRADMVRVLEDRDLEGIFGTLRPELADVRACRARLAESLTRGLAIALPVFEGNRPVSWYFAGRTAD